MTGTKMLIVFEDDGCLHVYESPEAAALAIEGLDAEDTIRAAFDETGGFAGVCCCADGDITFPAATMRGARPARAQ